MSAATQQPADETINTEDTDTKAQEEAEAKLLLQIAAEHALCDDPTWRNKQLKRFKIYNNQAPDERPFALHRIPDRLRRALRRQALSRLRGQR